MVSKFKLFTPKAVGSGGKDDILKPILGYPDSVCTETYVAIGPFNEEVEAKNAMSYINTKFFHFLLTLKKNTQDCLAGVFAFIPMQDFSKSWTDEELFKKQRRPAGHGHSPRHRARGEIQGRWQVS